MFRIGMGMDSHPFENKKTNKPLTLGGVKIDGYKALMGNSDADVILHALFNAISQALGKRSIGFYCDPLYKNAGITSSIEYIKLPLGWLRDEGYSIVNVGITLECREPKIEPISMDIQQNLALILGLDDGKIGINATSGEDLTSFGLGKGIRAFAIVLITKD